MREELLETLDTASWRPVHTRITLALGVAWLLDAFEVSIIGSVLPTIAQQWDLSGLQGTSLIAVWLVGIMAGAQGAGVLADRFGRRRLFLVTLTFYATFTLMSAFSVDYPMLMVLRFLTALGVGAEYSAINAAISEFIPARYRGRANAAVMSFWGAGALVAAGVGAVVLAALPAGVGWRVGFAAGAVMALVALLARRTLPESPRWLLRRGETGKAGEIVERITGVRISAPDRGVTSGEFRASVGELLRRVPGRTALGAVLDFSEASGYYGLFAFFAVLVTAASGIPASRVPAYFAGGSAGALAGGVLAAAVMDRFPRATMVTSAYVLAAASLGVLGLAAAAGGPEAVMWAFFLANGTATAAWVSAYPTFTELFPTPLRSTGVGFSVSVGRVGAALSSMGLAAVASAFSLTAAFGLLAGFWLLGAAGMYVWSRSGGPEGCRVPLERLEPEIYERRAG